MESIKAEESLRNDVREFMKVRDLSAADLITAVREVRDAEQARIDKETQAALDELNAKRKAAGLRVRGVRKNTQNGA